MRHIDDFTGPLRVAGEELNFQQCPACGDRRWKVYVNVAKGVWWCHTGECQGKGRVDGVGRLRPQLAEPARQEWPEISMPENRTLFNGDLMFLWDKYKIDDDAAFKHCLSAQEGCVMIPYFNRAGQVVYYNRRRIIPGNDPKYNAMPGRHPLYVPMNATGLSQRQYHTLVVVEGVFDAIRVWSDTGMPVVALGGKSLPRYLKQDLLDMVSAKLVIALDNDALIDALRLRKQIGARVDTEIVVLPAGKDPADLGHTELNAVFQRGSK